MMDTQPKQICGRADPKFVVVLAVCAVLAAALVFVLARRPPHITQRETSLSPHPATPGGLTPAAPPRIPAAAPGQTAVRPPDDTPARPEQPVTRFRPTPSDQPAESLPPVFEVDDSDSTQDITLQVYAFVRESLFDAGPDAVDVARQLLASDKPLLRSTGAILLIEAGQLSDELLATLAADPDPAVALNALGWLSDLGDVRRAEQISALLGQRSADPDVLLDALASDALLEPGRRATLEAVCPLLPPEDAYDLCGSIADDPAEPYGVRMKSAMLLAGATDFEAYRERVAELAEQSDDRTWSKGLQRLMEQLAGPAEVHAGPPSLTMDTIDVRMSRPYPTMLEDLAQHVESVLSTPQHSIAPDARQTLEEYIEEFSGKPLSETETLSLRRLKSLAARLKAPEQPE